MGLRDGWQHDKITAYGLSDLVWEERESQGKSKGIPQGKGMDWSDFQTVVLLCLVVIVLCTSCVIVYLCVYMDEEGLDVDALIT